MAIEQDHKFRKGDTVYTVVAGIEIGIQVNEIDFEELTISGSTLYGWMSRKFEDCNAQRFPVVP